jgi:hypothetical protein
VGEKYKRVFGDQHMAADRTPVGEEVQDPGCHRHSGRERVRLFGEKYKTSRNSRSKARPVYKYPREGIMSA